jgi:hypothetical protein
VGKEQRLGISQISVLGFLATSALLLSSTHAASPEKDNRSEQSCNEAVAKSRMICVSRTNCQREIGEILRACRASDDAVCAMARRDLRAKCGGQSPWDGFADCNAALEQIQYKCAR